MKNMQLLTEKDLEYFRKMETEGGAVILELSEEQLLNLDFSCWMSRKPETIRESEVVEWMQESEIEMNAVLELQTTIVDKQKGIAVNENIVYKTLAEWLESHELADEQYKCLVRLISGGMSEKQILDLLSAEILSKYE